MNLFKRQLKIYWIIGSVGGANIDHKSLFIPSCDFWSWLAPPTDPIIWRDQAKQDNTASSGGYWRHFYLDSEATAQCELFLTALNRNILLTYLLT